MAGPPSPLQRALAALTTGIYVLTTRDGAVRHGMSSSWVTQVSGTPPLLLAAVDIGHVSHAMIERGGRFAMNVVGGAARHLEDYFYSPASRAMDNLASLACDESPAGLPYLRDALASLECRVVDRHRAGDHTLFVADITDAVLRRDDRPLTSLDLEYVYVGTVIHRAP
jgi:flavin reductase